MQRDALLRQWQILAFLAESEAGATVAQLIDRTAVNDKTIRRDLDVLRAAGFPLVENVGRRGLKTWQLEGETRLLPLRFTLEEAAALYLGRQFLESLSGTYFHSGAQTALVKIRGLLSDTTLRHLEKMAQVVYCHAGVVSNYAEQARLIDDLQQAVEDQHVTAIEYHSLRATETVTLEELHPYGLAWHKQALYLVAWSLDHDSIRTFKIDRIRSAQPTREKFERPADFSLQEYLQDSFGIMRNNSPPQRIAVRFSSKVARLFAEKKFHPSQKVERHPAGQILVTYELSSLEELTSWLLSFGPEAEVLEPTTLREEMVESLRGALGKYEGAEEKPARPQKKRRIAK